MFLLIVLLGAVLIGGVGMVSLLDSTDFVETEDLGYEMIPFESIPSSRWEALVQTNVFFGHQSVGQNVLDGLSEILDENPEIRLNIVESTVFNGKASGNVFHAKIGQNLQPTSKIESFSEILISNKEHPPSIALAKFCYVDLLPQSDPVELFEAYTTAIGALMQRLPQTVIIHVTIPIESVPRSTKSRVKDTVKRTLRRPTVDERNLVRHRYNEMLRSAYEGKEPIFDIARLESTDLQGFGVFRSVESENVPFMDASFTTDGGHLNQSAGRRIAEQLLIVLADAANQNESSSDS